MGESIPELYHFTPQEDGYINVDEKTTSLYLVFISPPHFWMFTTRAVVFAAGHIVKHPDFKKLVEKVAEVEPGTLLSEKSQGIFALAQKIAEDVRESLLPASLTPRLSPQGDSYDCVIRDDHIRVETTSDWRLKFKVRQMIYYGGAFFSGFDVSVGKPGMNYFVVNAQRAKIDLSLDKLITLSFYDPEVETTVWIPSPKNADYGIRLEKGFEADISIFTDPIKRIGLMANFGRIVKYVIEIVAPPIADCIPDGDTWGHIGVAFQDLGKGIEGIIGSSWDEILRTIVTILNPNSDSWIIQILKELSNCSYSPDIIISTLAKLIGLYPLVVLWDAFTKYIPFGYELFAKPKMQFSS